MTKSDNLFSTAGPKIRAVINKAVKWRYLIALIIFAVLVLCKVNGSSIGMWKQYIPSNAPKSEIAGKERPIRSDEWEVQTPYFLAQSKSSTPYSVINHNISTSGQNMIVSYGAPVWDISTLAKPLNWGYLLFGATYGTAWYWDMKIILMILLSFEICMIITHRHTMVSLLGSLWIAFSPAVQWWFMQHVGDIVLYMQAVVVIFYYYLIHIDHVRRKIGLAFLFGLACVGYVLTIYPAIQVPLFYLGVLLIIITAIDLRKQIKPKAADGIIAGCTLIFIALMLLHVYMISKGAISSILHTTYPGRRISCGGEGQNFSFYSFLTNPFLPYKDFSLPISNDCEISGFYNFLPAVLLVLPFMIKKKSKNLKYGVALSIFSLLCVIYLYVKIPVFLAKVTLLSYVTGRIVIAYGVSATYLSIWALSAITRDHPVGKIYSAVASCVIGLSYLITVKYTGIMGYVRFRYYFAFILVLILLNYLLIRGRKRPFSIIMAAIILISGITVNPVVIGLGDIYDNALSKKVQSIGKAHANASWISVCGSDLIGSFLYANGVKCIDGTNYYPDMKKWKLLDPHGKYNGIYNRYEHIMFSLTAKPTSFTTPFPDSVNVNLNTADLKKLKVSYILSNMDPGQLNKVSGPDQIKSVKISFVNLTHVPVNGYYIYHVKYR